MMKEDLIRYSMELMMLKQLLKQELISKDEYKRVEKELKKDYGIISNILA